MKEADEEDVEDELGRGCGRFIISGFEVQFR